MTTAHTKLKRRFVRFSLRTLLLFMLVVCVALGWKVERTRKQRDTVAWVHQMGGSVVYDYEVDDNGRRVPNAEPPGRKWLRNLLGIDYFDDVVEVDLLFQDDVNGACEFLLDEGTSDGWVLLACFPLIEPRLLHVVHPQSGL